MTPKGKTPPQRAPETPERPKRARNAPHERPPRPLFSVLPVSPRVIAMLAVPVLLIATAIVHAPALGTFFAQDDITFLARARGLAPESWTFARLLTGALRWHGMNALFGVTPLPYHVINFALHLLNAALVFAVGRALLGRRGPAFSAALLFGVSSIAFTPLHWATGMGELLVTTFSLGSMLAFLVARQRVSSALAWLAGGLAFAAMLSKESAVLLPLVMFVADRRLGGPPRPRLLVPVGVAAVVFAAAFVISLGQAEYLGGTAYAMTFSPAFLVQNLATYFAWLVRPQVPVRDAIAASDPAALTEGIVVAVAIALALVTGRKGARHPEEVGAAWLLLLLAPVLPLAHHTYLYYLYLPWVGACWIVTGIWRRLSERGPVTGMAIASVALVAVTAIEYVGVRNRERAMTGDFASDRTVRESRMLRNVLASLDSAGLEPGSRVGFVNPSPRRPTALGRGTDSDAEAGHRYIPLESALRGGEALRVFRPGLRYLGFHTTVPAGWEDAHLFLYRNDGTLRSLGTGGVALAEVGWYALRLHQWGRADSLFRRSRAAGDTLADASFGLVVTSEQLGRAGLARAFGSEFLRRWPDDERAVAVARQIGGIRDTLTR